MACRHTHRRLVLPWEKAEYEQAKVQLGKMLGSATLESGLGKERSMALDEAVADAGAPRPANSNTIASECDR